MKTHLVRSQSDKDKIYKVSIYHTFAECDCEAFKFRKNCKHVRYILDKYYRPKNNQQLINR